jgi:hypothetical protein
MLILLSTKQKYRHSKREVYIPNVATTINCLDLIGLDAEKNSVSL